MSKQDSQPAAGASYWTRNLQRLGILLAIWFVGSYGVSILFIEELDEIAFFGFKLGFWFSQQGSIYIFLALILIYVKMMNSLDDEYEKSAKATDDEVKS